MGLLDDRSPCQLEEGIIVKTHRSNAELIPHKVNGRMYAIALVTNLKS